MAPLCFSKKTTEVAWVEDDTHLPTKGSPFGTQANFSFSAFPTICFGAETLKDDGCALRERAPETPPTESSHPRLLLTRASGHRRRERAGLPSAGVLPWVTAVCRGLCSLLQMAQALAPMAPVVPMVPKLPTLIDQGRGSHGLGNVDLLLGFGLWGLWGLFGGLGSASRDSQDNGSALSQLPPTIERLP